MKFYKFVVAQLMTMEAMSMMATNGVWTDNDWEVVKDGITIGVKNGVPYSTSSAGDRMIHAPQPLEGDVTNHLQRDNVQLVQSFLSEADFEHLFAKEKHDLYTYDNFLKAVAKFPYFCGENGKPSERSDLDSCKREVSAVFAHFVKETAYNSQNVADTEGIPIWRQGLHEIIEGGCENGENNPAGCVQAFSPYCSGTHPETGKNQCDVWAPVDGKQYFARGPLQMKGSYNYGMYSTAMAPSTYDSPTVYMNDPDKVLEDGYRTFASAIWYYMSPQNPKPSMHEVMSGFYIPNNVDIARGVKGGFGTSINILTPVCGQATETADAQKRIDYYLEFMNYFGLDASNEHGLSCVGEQPHNVNFGTGDAWNNFSSEGAADGTCNLVQWMSGYAIHELDSYKRCVCNAWGDKENGCPEACEEGQELVNGNCVAVCVEGKERVDGQCVSVCEEDQERINGTCVDVCEQGEERIDGDCMPICDDDEHLVDGKCQEKVTLDDLFSGLADIQNNPHYSEEEKSRTLYQVDQSLKKIEEMLAEYHKIMLGDNLKNIVLQ